MRVVWSVIMVLWTDASVVDRAWRCVGGISDIKIMDFPFIDHKSASIACPCICNYRSVRCRGGIGTHAQISCFKILAISLKNKLSLCTRSERASCDFTFVCLCPGNRNHLLETRTPDKNQRWIKPFLSKNIWSFCQNRCVVRVHLQVKYDFQSVQKQPAVRFPADRTIFPEREPTKRGLNMSYAQNEFCEFISSNNPVAETDRTEGGQQSYLDCCAVRVSKARFSFAWSSTQKWPINGRWRLICVECLVAWDAVAVTWFVALCLNWP